MRIAMLGGSFNPIHIGHLFLAETVLETLGYDRVVLVPAHRSPFKLASLGMEDSARVRLEMIAASIAGDPRLTLDDCEIRRGGVSYTVDTIEDIARRYEPTGRLGLVIGDDLAGDFLDWRRSADILDMADVAVARRVGAGEPRLPFPCARIANDVMEVSSGMIRARIAGGGAWRCLVPAGARAVIEGHGLYGFSGETSATGGLAGAWPGARPFGNLAARVEEAARESLSFERFMHSRNTALLAWDLCRRFRHSHSLDPACGYLAGVAHDIAKPLGDREQARLAKDYGKEISRVEREKPSLLHGKAGAALLRDRFGVRDGAVLEAVAAHTAGLRNMGPLAKAVYIADKMEVTRDKIDPELRRLVFRGDDLDEIFAAVLRRSVASIRSKRLRLSEDTLELLEKVEAGERGEGAG